MHLEGLLVEDRQEDTVLYAADLKVRISDWFFLKKEPVLKYAGLEHALIKLQRTDSVWRHQFLTDYFSSPAADRSRDKEPGMQLSLRWIDLKNVTILKKDAWLGEDMTVHLGALSMTAKQMNLSSGNYEISKLLIQQPEVVLSSYPARRPGRVAGPEINSAGGWGAGNRVVQVAELRITNGVFKSDKQTGRQTLTGFDGQHILFSEINGLFTNVQWKGDSIGGNMELAARERSGFGVQKMTSRFRVTPAGMDFQEMDILTGKSRLKHSFSMSYDDFSDMGNFLQKVRMGAVFADSYVDTDDIAFFAPALASWKMKFRLNGKFNGTVSDLNGRSMLIASESGTLLNGDISLTGLPSVSSVFIDLNANQFSTSYHDLVSIVPAVRKVTVPDLSNAGNLTFTGNFTGFIRDFVADGRLDTRWGSLVTDLNVKLPQGQQPVYSGRIATSGFQLGSFLQNKNFGSVALDASIQGKGINEKDRLLLLKGSAAYLEMNGYRYHSIQVNGRLDKNLFEGVASVRDPNADFLLNGVLDLNGPDVRYKLDADVAYADLRLLQLTRDSLSFRGKANLDFNSTASDFFNGRAEVRQAELTRNGKQISFDSLVLVSGTSGGEKTLQFSSNEFEGNMTGRYRIKDLPGAVQYFLHHYYPSYIPGPEQFSEQPEFRFDLYTYSIDDYLRILKLPVQGFSNGHYTGNLSMRDRTIRLQAEMPQLIAGGYNFDNVRIHADGTADSLWISGVANNISINDSLQIAEALFSIRARNDSSKVSIQTGAKKAVEKADINALVLTYGDGFKIEFDPSSFSVNGKTWTINESGELTFRKNNPARGQLLLSEADQKIVVTTSEGAGEQSNLTIDLTKLNLGDLSPYFLPKNRLEGLISGNILVEDPTGKIKISSGNMETKFLRLDNDSLGEVKASFLYDHTLRHLKLNGNTINQEHYLGFDGNMYFGAAEEAKNNLIALKAKEFSIGVLERFLGTIFSDIQGNLTGDVNLSGAFRELTVSGKGRLKDAGLKVNFTQCYYKIPDTDISLTPSSINLNGLVLIDTVTGNPLYITGGIEHQAFQKMFFNLDVSTRKPGTSGPGFNKPVQMLRTTIKDNKVFYGDAKGTGSLSLLGPQSDMYMKLDVIASDEDSSFITLPPASTRESGFADFLVERKYGREMTEQDIKANATNIVYDVDITVNKTSIPRVGVRIILDELTGDEIKAKGSGSLNIRSGTTEPMSMRGRFDIEEGNYVFTFQSFFKKPFELRKNGQNFIEWTGDPYEANIRFEALYKAEKVNFAPLADLLKFNSASSNARGDVYVVATLTDQLFKPAISFSLDFPPGSVAVSDPEMALVLQQLQKNPNELNRQVTYLIVFNSFAPGELASGPADLQEFDALSTISGILLHVISDQINKILGNLLKSDKYNISLNTSIYNRNIIDQNDKTRLQLGSNINFSIGRSFFNNRFIISTGLGFEAPLQQSGTQQAFSQQVLPDVTLEWLINQSGSIRASFFYKENTDYLATGNSGGPGRARRIGTSLSYRKDFDRLGDLFRRKKKRQDATATPDIEPAKEE